MITVHPIERLWREVGLPEYFLGNGGTNHKLYALFEAIIAAPASPAHPPVQVPVVKALTYDEVEDIIEKTEPPYLSDKGDRIWTRRMAVALADLFNSRIPLEPQGWEKHYDRPEHLAADLRHIAENFDERVGYATLDGQIIRRAAECFDPLPAPPEQGEAK